METTNKNDELTQVIIKFALIVAAFVAGCYINYLETTL